LPIDALLYPNKQTNKAVKSKQAKDLEMLKSVEGLKGYPKAGR
jgi:hypothetical protein